MRCLALPDVNEQCVKIAVEPVGGSIAETTKFLAAERTKWHSVIKTQISRWSSLPRREAIPKPASGNPLAGQMKKKGGLSWTRQRR
jgi:hypothetical protein